MATPMELARAANVAFENRDVDEFRRLLTAHPELLRHAKGTDRWMWQAAAMGDLPLLEALVSLGLNVNEGKELPTPDDPDCAFCQVEGPIVQAAGNGHLEAVRWLLDRGAQINYTINGKTRCVPLLQSATAGHLEVVKLLVEKGADIHATFNGHTPLSQAVAYGRTAVADYLRSVGAVK